MENIDAVIYSCNLIEELENNGFFSSGNLFIEKKPLYNEILKTANQNITDIGEPMLTHKQLDVAVKMTMTKLVNDTLEQLINDDFIKITGVSEDGKLLYGLNEIHKKLNTD